MLSCFVADTNTQSIVAKSDVLLTVSIATWPVWDDVLILSDDGMLRSVCQSWTTNVSNYVLNAVASSQDMPITLALKDALALPDAVLAAAVSICQEHNVSLMNKTIGGASTFSLTLNGPAKLILRARWKHSFSSATTASLGDAPCTIGGVTNSGDMLLFTTPATSDACPVANSAGVECGHMTLTVGTAASDANGLHGVTLQCPPFCPGSIGDIATIASSGGYGPAVMDVSAAPSLVWIPPRSVQAQPYAVNALTSSSSLGIYYVLLCFQTGAFTDPTTGACADPSNAASFSCAYGSGDSCRMCPSNALCPSGTLRAHLS